MTNRPAGAAILTGDLKGNASPPAPFGEDGGLRLPTAELMALGGDARITLDEQSGLNAYGCAPKPMPAIAYASSTASTVSAGAYAQARAFHFQLREAAKAKPLDRVYAEAMEEARRQLRLLYDLHEGVDIAFGPSGTDLEYLSAAIALADAKKVRNIVVEVDEVGSGCLNAQKARYFAPQTALGVDVEVGAPVPGFPEDRLVTETVTIRAADGSVRDPAEREQALQALLDTALEAGERPLLHVIHRSKTGLIAPDPEALRRLADRFGDRVDLVVDACQGRISCEMLHDYLALGATVFVTGSKFIGGPPFSAFALVPPALGERLRRAASAPEGLGGFFARGEIPGAWRAMDDVLAPVPNFGLLLRLECGIFELARLLAYPKEVVGGAIAAFDAAVRALPPDAPLRLLPSDTAGEEALHPLDRTMLHTFELAARHPSSGRALDIEDARAVYAMLYTDMSGRFTDPEEKAIAAETCHVGQPVRCLRRRGGEWAPTLRLSLSAPQISEVAGLDEATLERRFATDLAWINAKIRLVLPFLPPEKPA